MKKILFVIVMALLSIGASANSIRYFTRSQAVRTAQYLNQQQELMIYCGYENELATYVIVSDVWYEPVNSAYCEIWLYGFDAYTGEEIYMPIDLACIWLYSGNRMYSAATYLRFRHSTPMPTFRWYMPPYNPFTHIPHPHGYMRTYHYDVHQPGWMPPAYGWGNYHPVPGGPMYAPYYLRRPGGPAPMHTQPFTPGVDRPVIPQSHDQLGNTPGGRSSSTHSQAPVPGRSSSTQPATTRPANSQASTPASTSRSSSTVSGNNNQGSRSSNTTSGNGSSTTRSGNTTTGTPSTTGRSSGTVSGNGQGTRTSGTSTTGTSQRGSSTVKSANDTKATPTTNTTKQRTSATTSTTTTTRNSGTSSTRTNAPSTTTKSTSTTSGRSSGTTSTTGSSRNSGTTSRR